MLRISLSREEILSSVEELDEETTEKARHASWWDPSGPRSATETLNLLLAFSRSDLVTCLRSLRLNESGILRWITNNPTKGPEHSFFNPESSSPQ